MRAFRAGIILLLALLLPTAAAFGQGVKGDVESIGFDAVYRPECWTPMLVNLTSTLSEPAEYDIVVEQEDLDSDTAVYKRRITLNAGRQDKFWVYFRPRTTRGSLPPSQADLQRVLRVSLLTPGGKLVIPLGLPKQGADNIDDRQANRGAKLVLVVNEGGGLPGGKDYNGALGLIEDVVFVPLPVSALPENELGYDGVDAVLWTNAEAQNLEAAGSRKLAVLERYVRQGGHLVVAQPVEKGRIEALAPLLPVEIKRGDEWRLQIKPDPGKPGPLRALAIHPDRMRPEEDTWRRASGNFQLAWAQPKPGAVVERWIDWANPAADTTVAPKDGTPYIARIGVGLGAVTWLAQDATAPTVNGVGATGWAHVWDVVFGWRNETRTWGTLNSYKTSASQVDRDAGERVEQEWETKSRVDLGRAMLEGTDHLGKAGAYVLLAVFFFIGYWVIAGPGSYVFLAGKRRTHYSWTAFAMSALVATLLTVGVVKLVLRGSPEAKHFTVLRQAAGEDAVAISRVGLYIPRDGMQEVSLPGVSADAVSTLSALAIHPAHLTVRDGFLDTGKYEIPIRDDMAGVEALSVEFPYRSTLKKLQAQRVGPIQTGLTVSTPFAVLPPYPEDDPKNPKLKINRGYIQGKLTNTTGADLINVFIAFRYDAKQEFMLYVPGWGKGQVLDVETTFNAAQPNWTPQTMRLTDLPNRARRGFINLQWSPLLQGYLEGFGGTMGMGEGEAKDPAGMRPSLVVMSLFDRIYPQKNDRNSGRSRVDLIRREGRELDLSPALAAGRVVVLAEARGVPLPFPMEVDGSAVAGDGSVFYQFVVPADRTKIDAAEAAQAENDRKDKDAGPGGTTTPPGDAQPAVEEQ